MSELRLTIRKEPRLPDSLSYRGVDLSGQWWVARTSTGVAWAASKHFPQFIVDVVRDLNYHAKHHKVPSRVKVAKTYEVSAAYGGRPAIISREKWVVTYKGNWVMEHEELREILPYLLENIRRCKTYCECGFWPSYQVQPNSNILTDEEQRRGDRTCSDLEAYFTEDALHYPVTAYDRYQQYKQEKLL